MSILSKPLHEHSAPQATSVKTDRLTGLNYHEPPPPPPPRELDDLEEELDEEAEEDLDEGLDAEALTALKRLSLLPASLIHVVLCSFGICVNAVAHSRPRLSATT